MKAITESKYTSLAGIIPGLIIMLMALSGLWGGPIPVLADDGTPLVDDNGAVVTEPAPPFNLQTFILGLGIAGVGAAAGDGGRPKES